MLFLILCPPCNAINLTRGDRTLYSNDTNLGSMESNMFGIKGFFSTGTIDVNSKPISIFYFYTKQCFIINALLLWLSKHLCL